MKTRNGLVSNSSTSSFVVMGYKLNENDLDFKQIIETLIPSVLKDDEVLDNKYYVSPSEIKAGNKKAFYRLFCELWNQNKLFDGISGVWDHEGSTLYLGAKLGEISSDDGGLDDASFDVTECLKKCEEVRRMLKLPIDQQPKIYTGCRSC